MAKVLIIDDEPRYRDLISQVLASDGHEAAVAANGRAGLDVGSRYHPDVLLADWMLKDDIHGLHVIHVLRSVLPATRAILMTGFPSDDLKAGAAEVGVTAFLEKPFDARRIRDVVRQAAAPTGKVPEQPFLAMIEVDAGDSIVFVNARAGAMMNEVGAGANITSLAEMFPAGGRPDLDGAIDRWVVASPYADKHEYWHLRSQEPLEDGSRLIVLRRPNESHHLGLALIEMLLGIRDFEHARWPFDERVLVIDPEAMNRAWFVSMLESAGAGCYAVRTPEEALRLLENDDELRFVVLDSEIWHANTRPIIDGIKAVRPNAVIVGTSSENRRDFFASMGVERFLQKPWRIDDLINTLTGRIGSCVSCGLPIPLRHPQPGETPTSWICCHCGARYRAVFDEDSPQDTLSNVQAADPD